MSVEEIFQTMSELVAEQFAMEPAEVTMDTSFETWAPIPWTWWIWSWPWRRSLRWVKFRKRI